MRKVMKIDWVASTPRSHIVPLSKRDACFWQLHYTWMPSWMAKASSIKGPWIRKIADVVFGVHLNFSEAHAMFGSSDSLRMMRARRRALPPFPTHHSLRQ
jgi:hypothetical protein